MYFIDCHDWRMPRVVVFGQCRSLVNRVAPSRQMRHGSSYSAKQANRDQWKPLSVRATLEKRGYVILLIVACVYDASFSRVCAGTCSQRRYDREHTHQRADGTLARRQLRFTQEMHDECPKEARNIASYWRFAPVDPLHPKKRIRD